MILEVENLHKTFPGKSPYHLLRGISLQIQPGESVAIMGKSGTGKSTLLHILGTLDTPTEGKLFICGKEAFSQPALLRNQHIGFIFQAYHLLEDFTVLDNVLMPLKISRKKVSLPQEYGRNLLRDVGLLDKEKSLAKYLSGGEKQRVTIARALCNQAELILADEPTGNLDQSHSTQIQNLLISKTKELKKALLVVTHDLKFAQQCDRVLFLKEGQLYNHP